MEQQIIEVKQADMLQAINRAEVDIQIATAKQYPRDIHAVLNNIVTIATMDKDTAEDCFYILRRQDGYGNTNVIEGISVRLAEIFAGAWGNLRIQSRIIGNDGRMITAQGICHDLETNVAISTEVKRRITNKAGRTFSEDMQVVTGNAAAAIAFRNAVLKIIPKAVTKRAVEEIKKVALGKSIDLETSRQNIMAYFSKIGVTQEQLFFYLGGIKGVEEIDKEKVFELRATANAIKEGTTTVQESFVKPFEDAKAQAAAEKKSASAKDKAEAAMKRSEHALPPGSVVDKATGEIINPAEPVKKAAVKPTAAKDKAEAGK